MAHKLKLYNPTKIEWLRMMLIGLAALIVSSFVAMPFSNSATRNTLVLMIQASCVAGIFAMLYHYKLSHEKDGAIS